MSGSPSRVHRCYTTRTNLTVSLRHVTETKLSTDREVGLRPKTSPFHDNFSDERHDRSGVEYVTGPQPFKIAVGAFVGMTWSTTSIVRVPDTIVIVGHSSVRTSTLARGQTIHRQYSRD